jgi:hypothetical protein
VVAELSDSASAEDGLSVVAMARYAPELSWAQVGEALGWEAARLKATARAWAEGGIAAESPEAALALARQRPYREQGTTGWWAIVLLDAVALGYWGDGPAASFEEGMFQARVRFTAHHEQLAKAAALIRRSAFGQSLVGADGWGSSAQRLGPPPGLSRQEQEQEGQV